MIRNRIGQFVQNSAIPTPTVHIHDDRYYTEVEADVQLAGKAPAIHTHDDRYFTETEATAQLAGKAATVHTHDDRYYTETEADALLGGKAPTIHTHDDRYFTETEANAQLSGKSPTIHTHDDRYYTETEADAQLGGKAPTTHPHLSADVTDASFLGVPSKLVKYGPEGQITANGTTQGAIYGYSESNIGVQGDSGVTVGVAGLAYSTTNIAAVGVSGTAYLGTGISGESQSGLYHARFGNHLTPQLAVDRIRGWLRWFFGSFTGILKTADISANREWTLPNLSGFVAVGPTHATDAAAATAGLALGDLYFTGTKFKGISRIDRSPLLDWQLNGWSGVGVISSKGAGSSDMTVSGAVMIEGAAGFGRQLSFDGIDDLTVTTKSDFTKRLHDGRDFTLLFEGERLVTVIAGAQMIAATGSPSNGGNSGFFISAENGNLIATSITLGVFVAGITLPFTGTLVTVSVTRSGTTVTVRAKNSVGGIFEAVLLNAGSVAPVSTYDLVICRDPIAAASHNPAKISRARIWDIAITPATLIS